MKHSLLQVWLIPFYQSIYGVAKNETTVAVKQFPRLFHYFQTFVYFILFPTEMEKYLPEGDIGKLRKIDESGTREVYFLIPAHF